MRYILPTCSFLEKMFPSIIKEFLKLESASGIILVITATVAVIFANSPLASYYAAFIEIPVEVRIGPLLIAKPALLWINDGLMAIFFFLVGLELKREFLEGTLQDKRSVILPAVGAIGGMAVPAAIYVFVNWNNPSTLNGWAIPAATDIAFALGILLLLGKRVPTSLKVFLVSLAIFDDVGAIVIIALFYTSDLSMTALSIVIVCLAVLLIFNRCNLVRFAPYLLIGLVMWVALLKSGVHATLAGVLLAFFIPLRDKKQPEHSPLHELEHSLHSTVAFGILPLFAFANAGISLEGVTMDSLLHPVPLGVAVGLFIGKQLGVFIPCFISIKLGFAKLPTHATFIHLYGVALLSGVGFTMSLFIGTLAFEGSGVDMLFDERLGIIIGSLLSGIAGYVVLHKTLKNNDVE